jgi:hypothetical protein
MVCRGNIAMALDGPTVDASKMLNGTNRMKLRYKCLENVFVVTVAHSSPDHRTLSCVTRNVVKIAPNGIGDSLVTRYWR